MFLLMELPVMFIFLNYHSVLASQTKQSGADTNISMI